MIISNKYLHDLIIVIYNTEPQSKKMETNKLIFKIWNYSKIFKTRVAYPSSY